MQFKTAILLCWRSFLFGVIYQNLLYDIRYNKFKWWWQRKTVWFWDDNLTANRNYIKELLRQMISL
ncbi:hypothetical protein FR934_09690 [Synechocystis sp. PCC 6803]|nr:hypothetical protein [Synechocystis sp. PCC 6803]